MDDAIKNRADSWACLILAAMLMVLLASVWNDSATMDELAHIPAGFGYAKELDYRLNPEHPPLLKALAAFSGWIFAHPHFPTDTKYWQEDVNGQWAQGAAFLYESGNNADRIVFWSRFPFIILALIFGWFLFSWTKKRFGSTPALLTLLFFACSPTFLAHSRYVTTDLGAAFGFFLGITSFIVFLENRNWRSVAVAGILFGIAELIKFSLVLLIPFYVLLIAAWVLTQPRLHWHERIRNFFHLSGKTILIGLIGLALIWIVYGLFTWNYPQERQYRDTEFLLSSYGFRPAVNLNLSLVNNQFTRPLGQYMLGALMVNQRAAGGNTAFFLGEVSATGSRLYFPLLYLLKEPLALHLLTFIALWFGLNQIRKSETRSWQISTRIRFWIHTHFMEFSALLFILFYVGISIKSPLNIGVRHILPIFPFIYMLVARGIDKWLNVHSLANPHTWTGWLINLYQIYLHRLPKYFFLLVVVLWLIFGTLTAFPSYLSYYNELAGGTKKGYQIAVDSNYDWGQDLKRLAEYTEQQGIEKISVDYFGGGNPRYYLGDKFEPWWSSRGPASGWFAISATFQQGAFGTPAPGFTRKPEDSYEWLKPYEPVARIGYSIFVYKLP